MKNFIFDKRPLTNTEREEELLGQIEEYQSKIQRISEDITKIEVFTKIDLPETMILPREIDHWDQIKSIIGDFISNGERGKALGMIEFALYHLEKKTQLTLTNGSKAFSLAAISSDTGAKLPVIGTFFAKGADYFHNQGIKKTETRLKEIEAWLNEIKPSLSEKIAHKLGV